MTGLKSKRREMSLVCPSQAEKSQHMFSLFLKTADYYRQALLWSIILVFYLWLCQTAFFVLFKQQSRMVCYQATALWPLDLKRIFQLLGASTYIKFEGWRKGEKKRTCFLRCLATLKLSSSFLFKIYRFWCMTTDFTTMLHKGHSIYFGQQPDS